MLRQTQQTNAPRYRGRLRRQITRILVGLIVLLLILGAIGFVYESAVESRVYQRYPPPGTRFDVGGYSLHLHCTGEGSPTVIVDAAPQGGSLYWSLGQPEVATSTRICTYDRAGYGWSDPSPSRRSSSEMVTELRALLGRALIEPPYVLVGHGLGGLYMQHFAMLYPDDVAGLVLIDSDHPEYETHMPEPVSRVEAANINALAGRRLLARLGVLRLLGIAGQIEFPAEFDLLPPETRARAEEFWVYNAQVYATMAAENRRTMLQESRAQVRRLSPGVSSWLPDVPLLVVTHGIPGGRVYGLDAELAVEEERVWQEMQRDMATLGQPLRGEPLVAEQSTFGDILLKQPDLVADAVQEVVAAARSRN